MLEWDCFVVCVVLLELQRTWSDRIGLALNRVLHRLGFIMLGLGSLICGRSLWRACLMGWSMDWDVLSPANVNEYLLAVFFGVSVRTTFRTLKYYEA